MPTDIDTPPAIGRRTTPPKRRPAATPAARDRTPRRLRVPGRQPRRCPVCEISLLGLPVGGRCPQCSFPYDRHTRAWTGRNDLQLGTPIVFVALSLAALALWWHVAWVFWPVVLGVPLVAAWKTWDTLVRMDGRFAAVSPEGVHFRRYRLGTEIIPWQRIVSVSASVCRMPRLAYLSRHDWMNRGGARQINLGPCFRTPGEGCEFAYAVSEGIRRYELRQAREAAASQPALADEVRGA